MARFLCVFFLGALAGCASTQERACEAQYQKPPEFYAEAAFGLLGIAMMEADPSVRQWQAKVDSCVQANETAVNEHTGSLAK